MKNVCISIDENIHVISACSQPLFSIKNWTHTLHQLKKFGINCTIGLMSFFVKNINLPSDGWIQVLNCSDNLYFKGIFTSQQNTFEMAASSFIGQQMHQNREPIVLWTFCLCHQIFQLYLWLALQELDHILDFCCDRNFSRN